MRRSLLPVVLMVAVLTGCSRVPTAPSVESTASVAPAGAPVLVGHVEDPPTPIQGGTGALGHITLQVGQAGIIECGPFRLYIHKNSLKEPTTIAMIQPNRDVMQVEFEVTPASANDFQVPLKLTALCADDTPATVKDEAAYWWDGLWTKAAKQTVTYDGNTITATTHVLSTVKIAPVDGAGDVVRGN